MSVRPVTPRPATPHAARIAALGTAIALVPLTALPAEAAAPLRPGPYYEKPAAWSDSGEFDPDCQGLDLTVSYDAHGVSSARHVLGSNGQAFFAKDKATFKETWTDNSTATVLFTIEGDYVFEEIAAQRVAKSDVPRRLVPRQGLKGPVFEFTAVENGGDVVVDDHGQLLYWTAGQIKMTNLFDTLGDHEPGGRSLRVRTVKMIGHHPLADTDICDVAATEAAKP
jgi:hypothetical protein